MQNNNDNYFGWKKQQEKNAEAVEKLSKELSVIANRFFSSPDGKKYARQMLKATRYFNSLPSELTDNQLRYLQAQRDFVDTFVIGLITNETLVNLIKDE